MHLDMQFPDGTNPEIDLTKRFIEWVDAILLQKKKVAVHCQAGLGRTGCL